MANEIKNNGRELMDIIQKAAYFHGHLGPFLVIGVRMGLIGLRELKTKRGDKRLRVTAMVKQAVPFSCVIDGIQVTTSCTIGNGKLKLEDSSDIRTRFELVDGRKITIIINSNTFNKLKERLLSNLPTHEVIELANLVATMPEEELFQIIAEGK